MIQKKLNIIFYLAILMFIATLIITNTPYPTFVETIIREVTFYLAILLVVIFVALSYYFKSRTNNQSIKKNFIKMIWGPILLVFFIGSILILQNKIYKDNQLISYDCVFTDHYGNIIYKSIMSYSCEKPIVMSEDEEEIILVFNEERSEDITYSNFNGVWIGTSEPMDSSIEIKTVVHLKYDHQNRIVFYQADMIVSKVFLYENQFYHTLVNERFQIEQIYTEFQMISTQIISKKPDVFMVDNEKMLVLPDFDEENLVEKTKVVYNMQANWLSNQQIEFTFSKAQFPQGYPEINSNDIIGTGSYNEDGYILDIRNFDIYEPNKMITKIIHNQNEINVIREIMPVVKKESKYTSMNNSYHLVVKKTIQNESTYSQKYKYYQRNNINGTIVSSKQLIVHYNIVDEVYGKQIIAMRKKVDFIDDYRYNHLYLNYFREFDYFNMLQFNFSDSIFLINHPMIDYMNNNQPS